MATHILYVYLFCVIFKNSDELYDASDTFQQTVPVEHRAIGTICHLGSASEVWCPDKKHNLEIISEYHSIYLEAQ